MKMSLMSHLLGLLGRQQYASLFLTSTVILNLMDGSTIHILSDVPLNETWLACSPFLLLLAPLGFSDRSIHLAIFAQELVLVSHWFTN